MKNVKKENLLIVVGVIVVIGASTIAKMLSEHFDLERVYAGGVFREKVESLGYKSLEEFYLKATPEMFFDIDREVDKYMIERARQRGVLFLIPRPLQQ